MRLWVVSAVTSTTLPMDQFEAIEAACKLTFEADIINANVVINELRRFLKLPHAKILTVY